MSICPHRVGCHLSTVQHDFLFLWPRCYKYSLCIRPLLNGLVTFITNHTEPEAQFRTILD